MKSNRRRRNYFTIINIVIFSIMFSSGCEGTESQAVATAACADTSILTRYCGVNSVKAMSDFYGYSLEWEAIARLVQTDEHGVSTFADLAIALTRLGLAPVPIECDFDALGRLGAPAVLFFEDDIPGHFVVCAEINDGKASIVEPPRPRMQMDKLQLLKRWRNKALVVFPSEKAVPASLRKKPANTTGQQNTQSSSSSPLTIGSLVLPAASVDIGVVPRFAPITGSIACLNEGTTTLRLVRIAAGCSCVSLEYPEYLASGEAGSISYVIDPEGKVGPQHMQLEIATDEPNGKTGTLDILYSIKRDIWLSSSRIHFGSHLLEDFTPRTLKIFNAYRGTGRIDRIDTDSNVVAFSKPRYLDPARLELEFDVWLRYTAREGDINSEVRVYFEEAEHEPLVIPVSATVLAPATIMPPKLVFGILSAGDSVSKTMLININRADETPLTTPTLTSDNESISFEVLDVDQNSITVNCTLELDTSKPGLHEGNIWIELSNDYRIAALYSYCFECN